MSFHFTSVYLECELMSNSSLVTPINTTAKLQVPNWLFAVSERSFLSMKDSRELNLSWTFFSVLTTHLNGLLAQEKQFKLVIALSLKLAKNYCCQHLHCVLKMSPIKHNRCSFFSLLPVYFTESPRTSKPVISKSQFIFQRTLQVLLKVIILFTVTTLGRINDGLIQAPTGIRH